MALTLLLPEPVINKKTARVFVQPNATVRIYRGVRRFRPAP
jgi:hypothetical protein